MLAISLGTSTTFMKRYNSQWTAKMKMNQPTVPNLFHLLRHTYGSSILKNVKLLVKTVQAEARFTNHRIFNLRCWRSGITPTSLKVKPLDRGHRARKIAESASRSFLKNRLHITCEKLSDLRTRCVQIKEELQRALQPIHYELVIEFAQRKRDFHFAKSKADQIKKFETLQRRESPMTTTSTIQEGWVKNLSQRQLTDSESQLLQKGLSFNATSKQIPPVRFVAKVESSLSGMQQDKGDQIRYKVARILAGQGGQKPNLTRAERTALRGLRNDPSITILRADKGNATVIMDTADYIEKMAHHLSTGPYQEEKKCVRSVMNKLKAETIKITRKFKCKLSRQMSYKLNPKSNICPRIYGLPKIHKEGIPLRPIVDFTGSPTYEWARHLASILKPLTGQTTTYVHNAATFCDEIKRVTIEDTEVMVSYDVVSLYTKVPIQQALEIIQQKLDKLLVQALVPMVQNVVTDFEKGILKAVNTIFGEHISLRGCFFHFQQVRHNLLLRQPFRHYGG